MRNSTSWLKILLLAVWVVTTMTMMSAPASARDVEYLTINSVSHCCLNTALTTTLEQGVSTITYESGAWLNHVPSGVYLGFVRLEIPELDLVFSLGTDTQVGYATYAAAEQAAMGDQDIVVNDSGGTVTGYFFVMDSCNDGGYCGDNSGQVIISVSNDTVPSENSTWSYIKSVYR